MKIIDDYYNYEIDGFNLEKILTICHSKVYLILYNGDILSNDNIDIIFKKDITEYSNRIFVDKIEIPYNKSFNNFAIIIDVENTYYVTSIIESDTANIFIKRDEDIYYDTIEITYNFKKFELPSIPINEVDIDKQIITKYVISTVKNIQYNVDEYWVTIKEDIIINDKSRVDFYLKAGNYATNIYLNCPLVNTTDKQIINKRKPTYFKLTTDTFTLYLKSIKVTTKTVPNFNYIIEGNY